MAGNFNKYDDLCYDYSQSFPSGSFACNVFSYTILEHFINVLDCATQNFSQIFCSFVLHGSVD